MALSVSDMATKASPSSDSPTMTIRLASIAEPRCWRRRAVERKNLSVSLMKSSLLTRGRVLGVSVGLDLTRERNAWLRRDRVLDTDAGDGGRIDVRIGLGLGQVEQDRSYAAVRVDRDVARRQLTWLRIEIDVVRSGRAGTGDGRAHGADRKSTRLNSSHSQISYAVFCLKKKKRKKHYVTARGMC